MTETPYYYNLADLFKEEEEFHGTSTKWTPSLKSKVLKYEIPEQGIITDILNKLMDNKTTMKELINICKDNKKYFHGYNKYRYTNKNVLLSFMKDNIYKLFKDNEQYKFIIKEELENKKNRLLQLKERFKRCRTLKDIKDLIIHSKLNIFEKYYLYQHRYNELKSFVLAQIDNKLKEIEESIKFESKEYESLIIRKDIIDKLNIQNKIYAYPVGFKKKVAYVIKLENIEIPYNKSFIYEIIKEVLQNLKISRRFYFTIYMNVTTIAQTFEVIEKNKNDAYISPDISIVEDYNMEAFRSKLTTAEEFNIDVIKQYFRKNKDYLMNRVKNSFDSVYIQKINSLQIHIFIPVERVADESIIFCGPSEYKKYIYNPIKTDSLCLFKCLNEGGLKMSEPYDMKNVVIKIKENLNMNIINGVPLTHIKTVLKEIYKDCDIKINLFKYDNINHCFPKDLKDTQKIIIRRYKVKQTKTINLGYIYNHTFLIKDIKIMKNMKGEYFKRVTDNNENENDIYVLKKYKDNIPLKKVKFEDDRASEFQKKITIALNIKKLYLSEFSLYLNGVSKQHIYYPDIYIPEDNEIIEINGDYYHNNNLNTVNIYNEKVRLYKKHNLKLIEIWENNYIQTLRSLISNDINKDILENIQHRKHFNNIIIWDTETYIDENNNFIIYAVACVNLDVYEMSGEDIKRRVKIFYGLNAMDEFIDYIKNLAEERLNKIDEILENLQNKRYINSIDKLRTELINQNKIILYAHNSGKFDTYFIYNNKNIKFNNIINKNSSIISLSSYDGILEFKDTYQFMNMSLSKICKGFKIPDEYAKSEFSHDKFNEEMLNNREETLEKYKNDVYKYLANDVISLSLVFDLFAKNIYKITKLYVVDFISIPQLTHYYLTKEVYCKYPMYIINSLPIDRIIRKSIVGGFCYALKPYFISKQYNDDIRHFNELDDAKKQEIYDKINDYIFVGDINSLYPASCARFPYPIGPPSLILDEKTLEEKRQQLNSLTYPYHAIICCDVVYHKRENLILTALTEKAKDGRIFYLTHDKYNIIKTSVDLEDEINFNRAAKPEITKIYYMIEWQQSDYIYSDIVTHLYEERQKAKNGKNKNDALQLTLKLKLNSLYGKTIQKLIDRENKLYDLENFEDYQKLSKKIYNNQIYNGLIILNNGQCNTEIKKKKYNKSLTYLGAFILSYSKRIMREFIRIISPNDQIYANFNHFYSDTDSIYMHISKLNILKKYNKVSSNLGDIKNDLDGILPNCKIVRAIFLAPKNYILQVINKEKMIYVVKSKGVVEVKRNALTFEMFENMLYHDKSYEIDKIKQFKRNYRENQKEKTGIYRKIITKMINKKPYDGRIKDLENNKYLPIYSLEKKTDKKMIIYVDGPVGAGKTYFIDNHDIINEFKLIENDNKQFQPKIGILKEDWFIESELFKEYQYNKTDKALTMQRFITEGTIERLEKLLQNNDIIIVDRHPLVGLSIFGKIFIEDKDLYIGLKNQLTKMYKQKITNIYKPVEKTIYIKKSLDDCYENYKKRRRRNENYTDIEFVKIYGHYDNYYRKKKNDNQILWIE